MPLPEPYQGEEISIHVPTQGTTAKVIENKTYLPSSFAIKGFIHKKHMHFVKYPLFC